MLETHKEVSGSSSQPRTDESVESHHEGCHEVPDEHCDQSKLPGEADGYQGCADTPIADGKCVGYPVCDKSPLSCFSFGTLHIKNPQPSWGHLLAGTTSGRTVFHVCWCSATGSRSLLLHLEPGGAYWLSSTGRRTQYFSRTHELVVEDSTASASAICGEAAAALFSSTDDIAVADIRRIKQIRSIFSQKS